MDETKVFLQPAFILQHRKYRETSLIIDVLTRDFGIVSILAKGVRKKKSKLAGLLLAFTALKISYNGKNELKILTHVELDSPRKHLKGLSLYCGFYINELIVHFLPKNDPYPDVFNDYVKCSVLLYDAENIEQGLRFFELDLMEHIGYGLQLARTMIDDKSVRPMGKYLLDKESGISESIEGYVEGATLLALDARATLDKKSLYQAKQLTRRMIDFHLQGKNLKSRAVLANIIKQL